MFQSFKNKVSSGVAATERAAKKKVQQAKVIQAERAIVDCKKNFGLVSFDHFETGNQAFVEEAFQAAKVVVEAEKEKIARRKARIARIDEGIDEDDVETLDKTPTPKPAPKPSAPSHDARPPPQNPAAVSGGGFSASDAMKAGKMAQDAGLKPSDAIKVGKMAKDAGVTPAHLMQGAKMAQQAGVTPAHLATVGKAASKAM